MTTLESVCETIDAPTVDVEMTHGFCALCYRAGVRQGICGTMMPADPKIVAAETPGDCVVCFSPGVTCNRCGCTFP